MFLIFKFFKLVFPQWTDFYIIISSLKIYLNIYLFLKGFLKFSYFNFK